MAKVTFIYDEEEEDGYSNPQTVALTKGGIDDVDSMLSFFGNCLRASGYTYVEALGWSDGDGNAVWSH